MSGNVMTVPPSNLDIRILERADVTAIDPVAWDLLAETSCAPNPFYERWSLLPALKYLDKDQSVFVVVGYDGVRLVCLFPICLKKKAYLFRYATVWRFYDCLNTDVLCEAGFPLSSCIGEIMRRLKVPVIVSSIHGPTGFNVTPGLRVCQIKRKRKAVTRSISWEEYQTGLPSQHRKENKRVISRLLEKEGARYVTSDGELGSYWYPKYLELEQTSWKATTGRTILSDAVTANYFREAVYYGEERKKIEFQALLRGDEFLAASIRFKAQSNAYEIKTTYSGRYKSLYPGVVLELLNICDVLGKGYTVVDSCSQGNDVVERVWPDEITIYRTSAFSESYLGTLARVIYQWRRQLFHRSSSATLDCSFSNQCPVLLEVD